MLQTTIKKEVIIKGIGLHSGRKVNLRLIPAEKDTGLVFRRTDINQNNVIPVKYDLVKDTTLSTMLINEHGVRIGTIEHLMSALCFFGIDNLIMEVDAPEIPILDGSAKLFVKHISNAGIKHLKAPKKVLRIKKPIEVESPNWKVKILPSSRTIYDVTIDFDNQVIGKSNTRFELGKDNYYTSVSQARTFCMLKDIETLKANNLALGGSLKNAIVVDEDRVINKTPLRYKNEFVVHKLLDAIGDLYVSGYLIKGEFIGYKCGHESNNMLLRAIFANQDNYSIENADNSQDAPSLVQEPSYIYTH